MYLSKYGEKPLAAYRENAGRYIHSINVMFQSYRDSLKVAKHTVSQDVMDDCQLDFEYYKYELEHTLAELKTKVYATLCDHRFDVGNHQNCKVCHQYFRKEWFNVHKPAW